MRTRRANYPRPEEEICFHLPAGSSQPRQKRRMMSSEAFSFPFKTKFVNDNPFDALPEDLLITIMVALSSSASSPADLVNAKLTCKRFCSAASHQKVLTYASMGALTVKATKWSDEAHKYLQLCVDAGNAEAGFMLGMIRFYCLMNRGSGIALMAEAAIASHPCALYSLAVIQFNGSGGSRKDKVLRAGVVLCAKAAAMGHIDAMRELGHCLQDGYGVKKNAEEGRKILLEANAREAAASARNADAPLPYFHHKCSSQELNFSAYTHSDSCRSCTDLHVRGGCRCRCSLVSNNATDFEWANSLAPKTHAINTFLVEWFALYPPLPGLRLCSYSKCGRPETRRHEFRRCSACGSVNYCSRACQAVDWKIKHRYQCSPVDNWDERQGVEIVDPEAADALGDGNEDDDMDNS